MSIVPKNLSKLIFLLNDLPGVGPKTAQRLAFYIFNMSDEQRRTLADTIAEIGHNVKRCSFCGVVSDTDPCEICASIHRDRSQLCIIENSLDLFTLEKAGIYNGNYYVLNVKLNTDRLPKIDLRRLKMRIKSLLSEIDELEIIFALSTTIEGQTVSLYIKDELSKWVKKFKNKNLRFSKMAIGLSVGASIDYVDSYTLKEAFSGRREL